MDSKTARVYRVESVPKGYILLQPPFMCMCDLLIGEDTCDRDTVRQAKLDVLYKFHNVCVSPNQKCLSIICLAYLRVLQEVTSPTLSGFYLVFTLSVVSFICLDRVVTLV